MQSECNAMLGSWLSAAMSCYLRVVETREREAGGCVMWLDSAQKWLGAPARSDGQHVRTMTAMTLATRLYTFGQSEAPGGNHWLIRGREICTSRQFDVCDNQLDPKRGTLRFRHRKFLTIYYARAISYDIVIFQESWGPLKRFCTNLDSMEHSARPREVKSLFVLRMISGVSGECFERWGPFPSVSEYTKENWPTAYTTCNANVHSYTLLLGLTLNRIRKFISVTFPRLRQSKIWTNKTTFPRVFPTIFVILGSRISFLLADFSARPSLCFWVWDRGLSRPPCCPVTVLWHVTSPALVTPSHWSQPPALASHWSVLRSLLWEHVITSLRK